MRWTKSETGLPGRSCTSISSYVDSRIMPLKFLRQPEASRVLVHAKRLSIIVPWYPISGPRRAPVLRAYSGLRSALQAENLGVRSTPKVEGCSTNLNARVSDLIHKIPQLRDIDLFMSNGGPVELHEAIRQYHPSC